MSDTAGLHLLIKPNDGKYWRYKYRLADKEKLLPIGVYLVVSLAEAREKCLLTQTQPKNGINSTQDKKDKKTKAQPGHQTFSRSYYYREWHKN